MANLCSYISGAVVGALAGFTVSVLCISTFTMVSISAFFSTYFAAIFTFLGALFLFKFHRKNKVGGDSLKEQRYGIGAEVLHVPFDLRQSVLLDAHQNESVERGLKMLENALAGCIFLSGLCCLLLEEDWHKNVEWYVKLVPYSLLGVSISFTVMTQVLDLCELLKYTWDRSWFGTPNSPALVVCNLQYLLVLAGSMGLGLVLGLLFGFADIEDIANRYWMM